MELFGIVLALPVTLIFSLIFTWLMCTVFTRWPLIKKLAIPASWLVIVMVVFEIGLLILFGATSTYVSLGHVYTTIHFINFFLAPPAVAVLVYGANTIKLFSCAVGCWIAANAVIMGNIMVDEAIVGVDAENSFYSNSPDKILSNQEKN